MTTSKHPRVLKKVHSHYLILTWSGVKELSVTSIFFFIISLSDTIKTDQYAKKTNGVRRLSEGNLGAIYIEGSYLVVNDSICFTRRDFSRALTAGQAAEAEESSIGR